MKWLDRFALAGITAGIALMLQPWCGGSLRAGFLVTAVFTVLHIFTSHARRPQS